MASTDNRDVVECSNAAASAEDFVDILDVAEILVVEPVVASADSVVSRDVVERNNLAASAEKQEMEILVLGDVGLHAGSRRAAVFVLGEFGDVVCCFGGAFD